MFESANGLIRGEDGQHRCWWHGNDPVYRAYHDNEWGRPVALDRTLFEKLSLEGFQAGLSWLTILRKRDHFRRAFCDFEIDCVARFGPTDVERLLQDVGIVRHRGKIEAVIENAKRAQDLQAEAGSLAAFVWSFEPSLASRPQRLDRATLGNLAQTPELEGALQGLEATRLVLRRTDDLLRLHAGHGARQRSSRRLLHPRARRGRTHRLHEAACHGRFQLNAIPHVLASGSAPLRGKVHVLSRLLAILLCLVMLSLAPLTVLAKQSAPVVSENITARLVADRTTVSPGGTVTLAFAQEIREGWHTYWRNPGDSGAPASLAWELPDGVEISPAYWPAPEAIPYFGLMTYGHHDQFVLLQDLIVPGSWPTGTAFPIRLAADWLVCAEICIPETGTFALDLPVELDGDASRPRDLGIDRDSRGGTAEAPPLACRLHHRGGG